ncbi:MAG TPA: glycosyltransferase family 87 protein [Gemmataceae bacterium]|nr:glycosyltransferase family 87 protein [Gemmataceae bacterium]
MHAPWSPSYIISLVYDEFDLTAMALRGLNAERGRQAGLPENPTDPEDEPFDQQLHSRTELNDRYFLEYPHAALLIFRAGFRFQPEARAAIVLPAIADADYHNLATFEPCAQDEFEVQRLFVRATDFYALVMLVSLLALIAVFWIGYGPNAGVEGGAAWLLMPAALFFALNRYDVVPALFTALSFACLGRRRLTGSAVFLAVAVALKVYPILFLPLILRYLFPLRRQAYRYGAVFTCVAAVLIFSPLLFGADLTAVLGPYSFQLTRPPEMGMTIYGCLLPEIAAQDWFGMLLRLGSLAGVTALCIAQPITNLASLLRRGCLILLVFVTLAVFYSPQWVLWFAPLMLPLLRHNRRLAFGWAGLDIVTYLTFPVWFWVLPHVGISGIDPTVNELLGAIPGMALRVARFLVIGTLALQLVLAEWPWVMRQSWLGRWLPRAASILARKE